MSVITIHNLMLHVFVKLYHGFVLSR